MSIAIMSRKPSFHYDPSKKGLGQILGELEEAVMVVLWKRGESSVWEILDRLKRDAAYSSVITVANRLTRKSLLSRRKEGKTYRYKPLLDREQFLDHATRQILSRVTDIAPPATVVQLIDSAIDDDPEVLDALEKLIKKKRRARGGSK
jgi:BlaI family transcriptional regulator, penicillinase repressor